METCGLLVIKAGENNLKTGDTDKIFGQNIEDNIIDRVILATKQVISKKQATN